MKSKCLLLLDEKALQMFCALIAIFMDLRVLYRGLKRVWVYLLLISCFWKCNQLCFSGRRESQVKQKDICIGRIALGE